MKKGWVVMAIAGTVVCLLLVHYILGGLIQTPSGFDEEDLRPPFIGDIARDEGYPGSLSGMSYPMQVQPSITYGPTVYSYFGGVLELFLDNEGDNDVYAHRYYVAWQGDDERFQVNCSLLIPSGEEHGLGILHFAGPGEAGPATLEIWVEIWTSSPNGQLWDDKGELAVSALDLAVVDEGPRRDWNMERNPVHYYNKVNGLIDLDAVSSLAEEVRSAVPGDYSLLQIIKAYDLVRLRIEYSEDEEDHWQSPAETMSLGSGDCEDHTLLLASLITALGGTCRVNLIAGHAFPTVFIGNASVVLDVIDAIQRYYGNPVPVHYPVDHLGYWLVIDTNGLPYVGGYPAASSPAGGPGGTSWNLDDGDWMMLIDVTGETAATLL